MAETLTREYVVPLRKEWNKVPYYKRARKSAIAVKEFIAKHMKVAERDLDKVKLDVYLNNELWSRGARKAFNKVKVKAVKEGEIVRVTLAETPEFVKFHQAKHKKKHAKASVKETKTEEKKEEKTVEEKKEEVEKSKAVEEMNAKSNEKMAKDQKHASKIGAPKINRMAMKK